jgi:outer membrane protein assembly factor BamB
VRLMPGRMREVELVEAADEPGRSRSGAYPHPHQRVRVELDDTADRPGAESPDDVSAARTWVRQHALWLVASVTLVVCALVVTQAVLDRREDARVAALAAIPGIVPPVDASIGVLWRADPELATALQSGAVVEGVLVGGTQDPSGAPLVVGLDPDTGAVAWRTPVDLPTATGASVSSASPDLWISCTPVAHGDSHVAACTAQQYGEEVEGVPELSVWVVDPADGQVLADRQVPGTWGLAFVDDALVVARPLTGTTNRWQVEATEVVSGEPRWTWTTPTGTGDQEPSGTASLQSFEDHLVLVVDTRAWALTPAGEPVVDVTLDPSSWLQPARAGAFIESRWGSSVYSGTLLLADGSRVPIDETAGWLAVDDGTAPDILLTVGQAPGGADGLSGRSARTGERLWHVSGSIVTSLLLDGTVYVATSDALVAVDAATGDVRWRTEIDHMPQQLSTDGRYLLLPGPGVTLEAYTLTDGELAWTADLAQEVAGDRATVFVQGFRSGWHDPRLYVWMDTGAVAVLG